jgi:ABC-2 type transport system permease protein
MMKSFFALIRREYIEHRGAFFWGPLILVAVGFAATLLAFTVGRVDVRFSGAMATVVPMQIYEFSFLGVGLGWGIYLFAVMLFYAADGFAADKRNNAMLFWKSMPVSDFQMLLSKLTAAVTILPGTVFAIAMLSGLLMYGVAYVSMMIYGTGSVSALGSIAQTYGHVALALLVSLGVALLWYLPYIALVGAVASWLGRWAIPIAALIPSLISVLEWVTLGGMHPFATKTWSYLEYRFNLPNSPYVERLMNGDVTRFDGVDFASTLLASVDWVQVVIGLVFSLAALFIASEFRRRSNDN